MKIKNIAKRILNSHKDSTLNCGFMINPYIFGGGAVGGWKELARTTLGSSNSNIDVTSLSNKRYYMILSSDFRTAGNTDGLIRYNSDTGSNYATRGSSNGGADGTGTSGSGNWYSCDTGSDENFSVNYVANYSTKEKLSILHRTNKGTSGAGNAPNRREWGGKWANTSNAISSVTYYTGGSDTFSTNSEVVVLGWDPADTHTTNFWTELASNNYTSGNWDTTFAKKKYLWVQAYMKLSSGAGGILVTMGDGSIDTGNVYNARNSTNGASDTTLQDNFIHTTYTAQPTTPAFINMFIINVSSKEKLVIYHQIHQNTATASYVPDRYEGVGKYAMTTGQIDRIRLQPYGSGTISTTSAIKVWGSD